MNGNLVAEAKSERIAYDTVFIINTLLKPFHTNPYKLEKGSKSTADFDMPSTSPLSDIYEQAAEILQTYGYFVEDVTSEKLFFNTKFRITISVVSNLAILLKLKNDGKYILFDNIQKGKPMTETTKQPEHKDAVDKQDCGSHYPWRDNIKGTIIYKAPTENGADKITKILNSIFEESLKTSSTPNKIKVSSEDLSTVVLHINEIVYAYGWEITESTIAYIPYIIVERKKPDGVLLPVYNKGTNIYVDEQRLKQHLPKGDLGRLVTCGKSPVRQASPKSPTDKQVGGTHYQLPIQPIEYILANGLGYCEANVVKYVSRWRNKGGIQDLKKAIHYLEMLIEQEEKDASKKN